MLPKLIHEQIDKQDVLEEEITKALDAIVKSIDVKKLVLDPESVLLDLAEQASIKVEDVAPEAMENGFEFAQKLKKLKKDLVMPSGEDPDINKELSRDGRQD